MSALKKKQGTLQGLYASTDSSSEKKAVEQLREKINGLLERDPSMARKAALVLSQWLRHKPK